MTQYESSTSILTETGIDYNSLANATSIKFSNFVADKLEKAIIVSADLKYFLDKRDFLLKVFEQKYKRTTIIEYHMFHYDDKNYPYMVYEHCSLNTAEMAMMYALEKGVTNVNGERVKEEYLEKIVKQ